MSQVPPGGPFYGQHPPDPRNYYQQPGYVPATVVPKRGLSTGMILAIVAAGVALLVAGVCVVGMFAIPAFSKVEMAKSRNLDLAYSRQLMMAMRLYELEHGTMPPAVKIVNGHKHSWRVLILPHIEELAVYEQYRFEEAWDSPHNRKVTSKPIKMFQSPLGGGDPTKPITNYVVVKGDKTVFQEAGSFSSTGIPDGQSTTALIVETANSDIHWAEPRDLEFSQLDFTINGPKPGGISSKSPGAAFAFASGAVVFINEQTPPDVVRGYLTANGRETVPDPADLR